MEINDRTLIVDTREKWTQKGSKDRHIARYLERHGITWVVKKLDVGDYMRFGGNVSVDRKHGIDEIAYNLTNPRDKKRFMNEVRLAFRLGIRLVVLVETSKHRDLYDLRSWRSEHSPVTGDAVIRQMERLTFAYGVQFVLCNSQSTAKKILEILGIDVARKDGDQRGQNELCGRDQGPSDDVGHPE